MVPSKFEVLVCTYISRGDGFGFFFINYSEIFYFTGELGEKKFAASQN